MNSESLRAIHDNSKVGWMLGLLLALVLILALWVLGPMVTVAGKAVLASVTSRLAGSLVIATAWGLVATTLYSRRRKRETVDPEAMARREREQVRRDRLRQDLDHIGQTIRSAIRTVTVSNFYGPASRSRYTLPWYLVLGPASCGKTSLLLNSGLQFPLNEQADRHLYKLKSTERVEFLFANQAVFIDTPGEYTEGGVGSGAQGLWTTLLRRLFRVRPARAINGVIVCVDTREMLDEDAARREHLARTIRARLGDIRKHLRSCVPVYLVFTKCDVIPGFARFFAHLSRSEREQIFGCPSRGTTMDADMSRKEFHDLLQTLNAQIITRIHQERDCQARAAMFRFPQELAALGSRIQDFLFEALGPSRYHRPVMFRGFFFSSALSSFDSMAGSAHQGELAFQSGFLPSLGDYAKGFFLLRLLENFIIPEAGLADPDRERIWMLRFRRFGPQVAAGLLLAVCVGLLALSFWDNFTRMDRLEDMARSSEQERLALPQPSGAADVLPELSFLEQALGVFRPAEDPLLARRLGLYRGADFQEASRRAYLAALNIRLLPLLRRTTVEAIEKSLNDPVPLKAAMRAYLMLHQPESLKQSYLQGWFEQRWAELYPGRAAERKALIGHMAHLIGAGLPSEPLDEMLLAKARDSLLKKPLARIAYDLVKDEAAEDGHPPFTFQGALGGDMAPFSGDTYAIPHLYTAAGFVEFIVKRCPEIIRGLTEDSWIFGPNPSALAALDVDTISRDVRVMYFRDYVRHWGLALDALSVPEPGTLSGAAGLAEQFTSGVSPAVLVLREVRKNISFAVEDGGNGLGSVMKELGGREVSPELAGGVTEATEDPVVQRRLASARQALKDAQVVRASFKSLDALLDAEGGPTPALKAAHEALRLAGECFLRLRESDGQGRKVLAALQDIAEERDGTLRLAAVSAGKLPAPIRQWYEAAVHGGLRDMLSVGASAIDTAYRESVLNEYKAKLKPHYPFDTHSESDANLLEFSNFFKHKGVLDSFYDTNIRPFAGSGGDLRPVMGQHLPISAEAVERLNRAHKIQDAFFVSDESLGIRFLMEPYALDDTLKQVDLSYGDKVLSYWHGPVQGTSFVWPVGSGQSPETAFAISDIHSVKAHRAERGDWAFFRLLQSGQINRLAGNQCLVELRENGKWAQFLIQFRNKANPFDPGVCSFSLPESLR